jgi:hypothetical protein
MSSSRSGGRRSFLVSEHFDAFTWNLLTTHFNSLLRHNAHTLTREEHSVRILRLHDPEDKGYTLVRNDGKYLEVEIGLGGRILVELFSVGVFMKIHSGVLELFCGPTQCQTSKVQTQWFCRGCYCSTSKFVFTCFRCRHYRPRPRAWRKDKQMRALSFPLAMSFSKILAEALLSTSRRTTGCQCVLATVNLWVVAGRWFSTANKTQFF